MNGSHIQSCGAAHDATLIDGHRLVGVLSCR
jgi:hypothetical protein